MNLSSVAQLLQYTDVYPQFKAYVIKLFSSVAASVGWDSQPGEGKHLVFSDIFTIKNGILLK